MTGSVIINTYVETSTVAKVKKGLSILGQAKKLAETQNGSIEGWDFGEGSTAETAAQFWSYLKPHMLQKIAVRLRTAIRQTDCIA